MCIHDPLEGNRMILLTGATGTIGRPLLHHLLGDGAQIRAVTRKAQGAGVPAGVQVIVGEPTQPETIDRALAGASALFLNAAAVGPAVDEWLTGATKHGVARVVLLSALAVGDETYAAHEIAEHHRELEDLVTSSALPWVILRPGMFAANALMQWAGQIRTHDVVRGAYGASAEAPIHERDVAAVAARSLIDPDLDGEVIEMTGPESLTRAEMVETIGQVIGRPIRFEEVPPAAARQAMLERGFPADRADLLLSMLATAAGHPALVADGVQRVLGHKPASFADWVRDHAEAFGPAIVR
jgi:uncharacterized protein YbjT (DUF2867 family)